MRFLLLLALAACRPAAPVSSAPVRYSPPGGAWTATIPGDWDVRLDPALGAAQVVLIDPSRDPSVTAAISVTRFPNVMDRRSDARAFPAGRRDLRSRRRGAFAGAVLREHAVVRTFPGGFYRLLHSADRDDAARTAPVFEEFVAGFEIRE